jgi:hypothetical protein
METKNCNYCGNQFEQKNTTGHEQKYCTTSCRNKAANKRREDSILEKFKGTIQQTTIKGNAERENERRSVENNSTDYGKSFALSPERIFELVSTNANLTAENKRLEEKIKNVENDLQKLEFEYDELDSKFNEQENTGGMIGQVNSLADKILPFIPVVVGIFSKTKNEKNAQTKTA